MRADQAKRREDAGVLRQLGEKAAQLRRLLA